MNISFDEFRNDVLREAAKIIKESDAPDTLIPTDESIENHLESVETEELIEFEYKRFCSLDIAKIIKISGTENGEPDYDEFRRRMVFSVANTVAINYYTG